MRKENTSAKYALRLRIAHYSLLLLSLCLCVSVVPFPVLAQGPNEAAVVVDFGDGRVESHCVTFSEGSISGVDLLSRAGVAVGVGSGVVGTSVCKIGDTGCEAGQNCFCHCQGVDCRYLELLPVAGRGLGVLAHRWRPAASGERRCRCLVLERRQDRARDVAFRCVRRSGCSARGRGGHRHAAARTDHRSDRHAGTHGLSDDCGHCHSIRDARCRTVGDRGAGRHTRSHQCGRSDTGE